MERKDSNMDMNRRKFLNSCSGRWDGHSPHAAKHRGCNNSKLARRNCAQTICPGPQCKCCRSGDRNAAGAELRQRAPLLTLCTVRLAYSTRIKLRSVAGSVIRHYRADGRSSSDRRRRSRATSTSVSPLARRCNAS